MSYLSYWIKLYSLNRKRQKVSKDVSKLVEEARKKGGAIKAEEVYQIESFDLQKVDDEIQEAVTRYVVYKANKRFLPVPSHSEEGGIWEESNMTGRYHLTDKGITEIRKMIRSDIKERIEVVSPYMSLLIGLIGAITGLVALIKR